MILALKENIHYGPFGASLRWAGTLRLIPARQWTVVFVGKGVLNRGEGSQEELKVQDASSKGKPRAVLY